MTATTPKGSWPWQVIARSAAGAPISWHHTKGRRRGEATHFRGTIESIRTEDARVIIRVRGYELSTDRGQTWRGSDSLLTERDITLPLDLGPFEVGPVGEVTFEYRYRRGCEAYRIDPPPNTRGEHGRSQRLLWSSPH